MSFKLDKKQEELMVRIAELENGENHGGIITTTTATNDLRIRQVLIEHILQQRSLHKTEKSRAKSTLIIGSPSWIKKFKELLENTPKILQNNDLSLLIFNNTRKAPSLDLLAGKDIVLINYYWLETIKRLSVTWERIIFHDFTSKNIRNSPESALLALCQLKATFRWCLTNHKQNYLAAFLIPSLYYTSNNTYIEEQMSSMKINEYFLERVNLCLPNAEPTKKMGFVLDSKQKEMMASLEERENGDDHGGIVTVATNDRQIDQVIIAYILKQREQGTSEKKVNLIVGTATWIESWKLHFDEFIKTKLLNDNDLSIFYFNNRKKSYNLNEFTRNNIVITSYDTLKKETNLPILKAVKWERIILYEANKISDMNTVRFRTISQLQAKYRWCLTESPEQRSFKYFLRLESNDSNDAVFLKDAESVEKQNNLEQATKKQQANLIFLSAELELKRMKIVLNTRQKEFTNSMAQCEAGSTFERVMAYGMEENEIGESIIAFLLEKKYNCERNDILMGETLIVVSNAMKDNWMKHVGKLAKEDALNIHCIHENETGMFIEWERIIFYGISLENVKLNELYRTPWKLCPENRLCITEEITHRFSAHFLKGSFLDEWNMFKTTKCHFILMNNAIKASQANDFCRFSEYMWDAILNYTRQFYIMHFSICIQHDESLEKMYEMMCLGLDASAAALIIRVWADVNWNHTACKYDEFFMSREEMNDIIERWKKAMDLIEDAHIDLIRDVLDEKKLLYIRMHEHEQIVYDFDVFFTKAKEMSEQDRPNIVIFSSLIWSAAVVRLRKFFLARFQLMISSQNALKKLMRIVLESFTDHSYDCQHLHEAWAYAEHFRNNVYDIRYMHEEERIEMIHSVWYMDKRINTADIKKIRNQLEVSDLQILKLSKKYSMTIGKDQLSYDKVTC